MSYCQFTIVLNLHGELWKSIKVLTALFQGRISSFAGQEIERPIISLLSRTWQRTFASQAIDPLVKSVLLKIRQYCQWYTLFGITEAMRPSDGSKFHSRAAKRPSCLIVISHRLWSDEHRLPYSIWFSPCTAPEAPLGIGYATLRCK